MVQDIIFWVTNTLIVFLLKARLLILKPLGVLWVLFRKNLGSFYIWHCFPLFLVGRGVFQGAVSGTNDHSVAVVTLRRLFRQKSSLFVWAGGRGRSWTGRVNVPKQCPMPPKKDEYLLTGSVHFGEAWLGCAPRYRDFVNLYERARKAGTNPCETDTDWEISAQVHE